MSTGFDPIAVVEAAYRFDRDTDSWLEELTKPAGSFFPDGVRMVSAVVDAGDFEVQHMYSESLEKDFAGVSKVFEMFDAFPSAFHDLYTGSSLTSLSSVMGMPPREHDVFGRATPEEVVDYLGVVASDPSGFAIQIGVVTPTVVTPDDALIPIWNRICTHISAGFRLQRRYDELSLDSGDAVVSPAGEVEHAATEKAKHPFWREALREAAVNLERARSEFRYDDAGRGLELWKGLVRGTYSLVEYFDSDGRRFYVARENNPEVDSANALSRREKQVVAYAGLGHADQRIAYNLGLSVSTVSTYLRRARKKLGVDTRAELVRLVRELQGPAEHFETMSPSDN